jgi:ElaB/YqjD/DUF883 family membrane-anchored ribosome-binding protein
MKTSPATLHSAAARDLADRATSVIDQAAQSVGATAGAAKADIDHFLETAPDAVESALQRSISGAESIAGRGIDRARAASDQVRRQVSQVSERTTDYVQQEPVKALLMAAAAGAAGALLVGWLARSRNPR